MITASGSLLGRYGVFDHSLSSVPYKVFFVGKPILEAKSPLLPHRAWSCSHLSAMQSSVELYCTSYISTMVQVSMSI